MIFFIKMYHVRNGCEINIILNQSMHDRDTSIFHEFSTDSLLNISNYCYCNIVNRCYFTIIKHINKVLSSVISFPKKSRSCLLENECDCQFCFTSKLHPKL